MMYEMSSRKHITAKKGEATSRSSIWTERCETEGDASVTLIASDEQPHSVILDKVNSEAKKEKKKKERKRKLQHHQIQTMHPTRGVISRASNRRLASQPLHCVQISL